MRGPVRREERRVVGVHVTPAQQERAERGGTAWVAPLVAEAARWGARTEVFVDSEPVPTMRRLRDEGGVAGFLFTDTSSADSRALDLWREGIPYATMGRLGRPLPQSWVDIDNRAAMSLALDHLWARGHRRIGFVASTATGYWWDERVDGYRQWAVAHELDPDRLFLRAPHHRLRDFLPDLLRLHDRPTAVLSAGDGTCEAIYAAAAECGLVVGGSGADSLAVIGFDPDLVLAPALTTLVVDFDAVGAAMWDQLAASARWQRRWPWSPPQRGRFVACRLRPGESANRAPGSFD